MPIKPLTAGLAAAILAFLGGCSGGSQMVQTENGTMPAYCTSNPMAGLAPSAAERIDEQCRRIAAHRALERALDRQSARPSQKPAAAQLDPIAVAEAPVEYRSQRDGHRHAVSMDPPVDKATQRLCSTGTDTEIDLDGTTRLHIAGITMCRGEDGKWVLAG